MNPTSPYFSSLVASRQSSKHSHCARSTFQKIPLRHVHAPSWIVSCLQRSESKNPPTQNRPPPRAASTPNGNSFTTISPPHRKHVSRTPCGAEKLLKLWIRHWRQKHQGRNFERTDSELEARPVLERPAIHLKDPDLIRLSTQLRCHCQQ